MAERAAEYVVITRKNQLSKLCWYAAEKPGDFPEGPDYLVA